LVFVIEINGPVNAHDGKDDNGGRRQMTKFPSKRSRVSIADFAIEKFVKKTYNLLR
jgi:hypothetical protein